ncbi:MAG: HesB/IscA family protein [Pseudohongiellaceae bacterium]|jgi:iron-sulfur cluster assembly accessory protein
MTVEVFDVKDTKLITVTDAAAGHLQSQLNSLGKEALRLSVKESGCTGYMYVLEEVSAGQSEDITVALDNGMQVFVDAGSVPFLRGTELDLIQKGPNRVLQFNNPNVSVACGCGESFDIEAQS